MAQLLFYFFCTDCTIPVPGDFLSHVGEVIADQVRQLRHAVVKLRLQLGRLRADRVHQETHELVGVLGQSSQ